MATIPWDEVGEEALSLLQDLLRIDTTNAPDVAPNETAAAEFLAAHLENEGLQPEILESKPGKGNVICRIRGSGEAAPVLLSGHLDVVPADPKKWTHPPFAAEIHDGFVWGRGAIDMKNMVAMEVIALTLIQRLGLELKRDLIFAGVADEEAGCEWGSLWLAQHHPEKVRAEYAISEIGGFTMHVGGQRFYPVQVAEKGMCWLTIRASGTSGHGSLPNRDNPLEKIGRAAAILASQRLPRHNTPVVERYLGTLAQNSPLPNSLVLQALKTPLCDHVLDHVFPEPGLAAVFDASLHNTANPTVIQGGLKVNQVPDEAMLRVDGRLLPGFTGADLVREIEALIGRDYQITIDQEMPACETSGDDPIAELIGDILHRHDPEATVVQTMIPGFTDAKAWSMLGMKCWGFSPVELPEGVNFAAMFHGVDERIPVRGFTWGTRALFELVHALCVE